MISLVLGASLMFGTWAGVFVPRSSIFFFGSFLKIRNEHFKARMLIAISDIIADAR